MTPTFALGDAVISSTAPVLNTNPIKPVTNTTTPAPTTTKPSIWDSISNVLNVVKGASEVYSNVKPTGSSSSGGSGTVLPSAPSSGGSSAGSGGGPAPTKDNTLTYVAIGGGVLLAAGIAFAVLSKKKKGK